MESQTCSIGDILNLECNKDAYVSNSSINEIPEENKYLLSLRTGIKKDLLKTICTHHWLQFGNYYTSYQKSCCDPLSIHLKLLKVI
jgi:hypothetical protein